MTHGIGMKRKFNGEPYVEQSTVNNMDITWNPDDNRFYVSTANDCNDVKATFKNNTKGFQNAVQFARKH